VKRKEENKKEMTDYECRMTDKIKGKQKTKEKDKEQENH
jgi:hypothetical protein